MSASKLTCTLLLKCNMRTYTAPFCQYLEHYCCCPRRPVRKTTAVNYSWQTTVTPIVGYVEHHSFEYFLNRSYRISIEPKRQLVMNILSLNFTLHLHCWLQYHVHSPTCLLNFRQVTKRMLNTTKNMQKWRPTEPSNSIAATSVHLLIGQIDHPIWNL